MRFQADGTPSSGGGFGIFLAQMCILTEKKKASEQGEYPLLSYVGEENSDNLSLFAAALLKELERLEVFGYARQNAEGETKSYKFQFFDCCDMAMHYKVVCQFKNSLK